jgi:glycosyltransferase involved in cell wall biosynthesis
MTLRVAMLSPIAWSTPPEHYGPWEQVVATLTNALVERDVDVTLYATADSQTAGRLVSVAPGGYEVDHTYDVKVYEALHIARCFEDTSRGRYDVVHNHFDFLPLAFTRLVATPVVTTIHGLSSPSILPAYAAYDGHVHYVAISDADRHPALHYAATIHHGIALDDFPFRLQPDDDGHVVCFGRIHPDKGTHLAIDIARRAGRPIRVYGIVHDADYFDAKVRPRLGPDATFGGAVGGQDRAEALGAAAALIHPVEFDEPFGLSVVEAMACGTPAVVFRRGAMAETVRHGVTGFVVDDPAGAVDVLGRVDRLDRHACREHIERRFSAGRMADDYLALYRRVLQR